MRISVAIAAPIAGLLGVFCLESGVRAQAGERPSVASDAECIGQVEDAFGSGDFELAFANLSRCVPPTTRTERIAYLRIRGMVAYGLVDAHPDAERVAREAFEELLRMDPHAELPPETSPRFVAFFERVRMESEVGRPVVSVRWLGVGRAAGAMGVELGGAVDRLGEAWLHVRALGSAEYANLRGSCSSGHCQWTLEEPFRSAPAIEGFVEVLASTALRMHWIGGLGSRATPFLVLRDEPQSPPRQPVETRGGAEFPWGWVAAAAVLVLGVASTVTAYVIASDSPPSFSCPEGSSCFDLP